MESIRSTYKLRPDGQMSMINSVFVEKKLINLCLNQLVNVDHKIVFEKRM